MFKWLYICGNSFKKLIWPDGRYKSILRMILEVFELKVSNDQNWWASEEQTINAHSNT